MRRSSNWSTGFLPSSARWLLHCCCSRLTLDADIPVILPADDVLTLDQFVGKGQQPDEELLPDEASGNCLQILVILC